MNGKWWEDLGEAMLLERYPGAPESSGLTWPEGLGRYLQQLQQGYLAQLFLPVGWPGSCPRSGSQQEPREPKLLLMMS